MQNEPNFNQLLVTIDQRLMTINMQNEPNCNPFTHLPRNLSAKGGLIHSSTNSPIYPGIYPPRADSYTHLLIHPSTHLIIYSSNQLSKTNPISLHKMSKRSACRRSAKVADRVYRQVGFIDDSGLSAKGGPKADYGGTDHRRTKQTQSQPAGHTQYDIEEQPRYRRAGTHQPRNLSAKVADPLRWGGLIYSFTHSPIYPKRTQFTNKQP